MTARAENLFELYETIKQWDHGDRTDIKSERKRRIGDEFSRAQQHMYPLSRERSTTSKSITSDDNPMAMLRNVSVCRHNEKKQR